MKIGTVLMKVRNKLGPIGVKLSKHAPAILTSVGVVGMVGGTVLACKATKDVVYALDYYDDIKAQNGSDSDYAKQVGHETTAFVAKSYIPVMLVDAASIACIIGGARISRKRLVAMTSIASSTAAQLTAYRSRVKELEGPEKDQAYLKGESIVEKEVEKVTKKGKKKTVKGEVVIPNPDEHGQYAFQFKCGDSGWVKNSDYNLYFLSNVERECNRLYRLQGYLFLNQVYDMLGTVDENGKFRYDQEGQLVGWFDDGTDTEGVSFGIDFKAERIPWNYPEDNYIWIEPNVHGVIIDKI